MYYRFLSCLILLSTSVFGKELSVLSFYPDDNERVVDAPEEGCMAFIDDPSNYTSEVLPGRKIKVVGLGTSDRSASLLVDCGQKTLVFALKYISRSKRSVEDEWRGRLIRPDSSVGLTVNTVGSRSRALDLDISDRSYAKLQLSIHKNWSQIAETIQLGESVDANHVFDKNYLGYGVQRIRAGEGSSINIRANAGAAGFGISHVKSIFYNRKKFSEATWLRTPQPFGVGFGTLRSISGKQTRIVDRYFYGSNAQLSGSLMLRYLRSDDVDGTHAERYQIRAEEYISPEYSLRFGNANLVSCRAKVGCLVNEWILRSSASFQGARLSLDYGLLPHMVSTGIDTQFLGQQRINVQLKHKFAQKTFAARWPYFDKDSTDASTSESSGFHLEYLYGRWTYFLDQSASLIEKSILSNTVGAKFEGERTVGSLSGVAENKKNAPLTLAADLRYFFDRNLNKIAVKLAKTQIKVNVMSNAPGKPVVGAKVDLELAGKVLASRESSPDGVVLFSEARCCDEYVVTARAADFVTSGSALLTPLSLERTINIVVENYRKLYVDFALEGHPDGRTQADILNYYAEIGEAIVGCNECVFAGNYVYVPIGGIIDLNVRQEFIPFQYSFKSIENSRFDSKDSSINKVRVVLKYKGT